MGGRQGKFSGKFSGMATGGQAHYCLADEGSLAKDA